MKKQNKISFVQLLCLLVFLGCTPPDPLQTGMPYRIKNESGVDLKILFYNNHKSYFDSIFLFNNKYSDEFTFNEETGFYLLGRTDSLDFISYNEKKLIIRYRYVNYKNGKNPYNIDYYSFKDSKYPNTYVYIVSKEDFK